MEKCNCGGNSSSNKSNIIVQQVGHECPATVHETVCVQANVTITPNVDLIGPIESFCVHGPIIGACPGEPVSECTFTVSQNICVQIPLSFSADATVEPSGIVCGTPIPGPCELPGSCTLTRGFFANNPSVTNALIEDAGDSIILGMEDQGLSVTVTTDNASIVLGGNQPLPPGVPPIYQNLYAQLLTAKLNVLNGATCEFATTTIATADAFLAAGTIDQEVASNLVDDLSEFNMGLAEGCPESCPGDNFDL